MDIYARILASPSTLHYPDAAPALHEHKMSEETSDTKMTEWELAKSCTLALLERNEGTATFFFLTG